MNVFFRFSPLFLLFFTTLSSAQTHEAPAVFPLGTYEEAHEALYSDYPTTLFSVCDENLDTTFVAWASLLFDMERYSKTVNYDLKGIQLMLAVFCSEDGAIEHLTYGLMTNSRNVNRDELTAFFRQYIVNSRWKRTHSTPFFHDGRAGFPVKAILYGN
jgi:hypothetical protein